MKVDKRKNHRIAATAFMNMPVTLAPLPPYFGHTLKGRLIDLSSTGMALLINELIPLGTRLEMDLKFPDQTEMGTLVEVKHALPKDRKYLHGFEFLSIPAHLSEKLEKMSHDYIDCEGRIQNEAQEICRTDCSFFSLCKKPQKCEPVFDIDVALELAFRTLDKSPTQIR